MGETGYGQDHLRPRVSPGSRPKGRSVARSGGRRDGQAWRPGPRWAALRGRVARGGAAPRRTPPRNPPSASRPSRPGTSRRYEDKLQKADSHARRGDGLGRYGHWGQHGHSGAPASHSRSDRHGLSVACKASLQETLLPLAPPSRRPPTCFLAARPPRTSPCPFIDIISIFNRPGSAPCRLPHGYSTDMTTDSYVEELSPPGPIRGVAHNYLLCTVVHSSAITQSGQTGPSPTDWGCVAPGDRKKIPEADTLPALRRHIFR